MQLKTGNRVLATETQSTTEASHVSVRCVPTPKVRTPLITMKRKLSVMNKQGNNNMQKLSMHNFQGNKQVEQRLTI
jgi:hypothetical protein